jgi:hypothetical protein
MSNTNFISYQQVEDRVLTIRNQNVILDSDVAELYGVETKRINEAVKNNPDKFPTGYILELDAQEWGNLKSKISTSSWGGKNKLPKAFTEKGVTVYFVSQFCAQRHEEHKEDILVLSTDFTDLTDSFFIKICSICINLFNLHNLFDNNGTSLFIFRCE